MNEGRYSEIPEYLPFDLSFLELATFQVTLHHTLVQLLTEFIKKVGTAVILAAFHVHIEDRPRRNFLPTGAYEMQTDFHLEEY